MSTAQTIDELRNTGRLTFGDYWNEREFEQRRRVLNSMGYDSPFLNREALPDLEYLRIPASSGEFRYPWNPHNLRNPEQLYQREEWNWNNQWRELLRRRRVQLAEARKVSRPPKRKFFGLEDM